MIGNTLTRLFRDIYIYIYIPGTKSTPQLIERIYTYSPSEKHASFTTMAPFPEHPPRHQPGASFQNWNLTYPSTSITSSTQTLTLTLTHTPTLTQTQTQTPTLTTTQHTPFPSLSPSPSPSPPNLGGGGGPSSVNEKILGADKDIFVSVATLLSVVTACLIALFVYTAVLRCRRTRPGNRAARESWDARREGKSYFRLPGFFGRGRKGSERERRRSLLD